MSSAEPPGNISGFFRQLRPRAIAPDAYVFESEPTGRRTFGGITLGQAIVAAAQTVSGMEPHELHTLFLRPHMPGAVVQYTVDHLRDGRRFSTRRVRALEDGRLLNESTVSFAAPLEGLSYQAPAPAAPSPEALPLFNGSAGAPAAREVRRRSGFLFEQRLIRWSGPSPEGANRLELWSRAIGEVPPDPVLRAAALAALSDLMSQLMGLEPGERSEHMAATLNHTLYLHAVPAFDGWLQFVRESSIAVAGRVLMTGAIYSSAGVRCASLSQESLQSSE
jgi:acyl-CoA thioesterase-2